MKVLISNIGNTDPFRESKEKRESNEKVKRDGAALHIARVYQPDFIYLISTKEMSKHNTTNTKVQIENLYKKLNKEVKISIIKLNENDPSDFDEMHVYEKIHREIYEKHKNDKIYVNISSGTPQMMFAACLDIVSNDRGFVPVQVKSPQNGANTNIRHVSNEEAQKPNDNLDDKPEFFVNRCCEPNIFVFRNSVLKVKLKKAVSAYDYITALELIKDVYLYKDSKVCKMLDFAYKYNSMENDSDFYKKAQEFGLQHKEIADNEIRLIVQAFNVLKIKVYRQEYVDFSNRISPILFSIAKHVFVSTPKGKELYDKIIEIDDNDVEIINFKKAVENGLIFNNRKNGYTFLAFKHFVKIFEKGNYSKVDNRIYEGLRKFEEKVRNKTAHSLKPFTKVYIERLTENTIESVLNDINTLIIKEFEINTQNLNFFEEINKLIINEIDIMNDNISIK